MKGFAMKYTRRRGAKNKFQSHSSLRISRCLGAIMAAVRIETAAERRLACFRAGKD